MDTTNLEILAIEDVIEAAKSVPMYHKAKINGRSFKKTQTITLIERQGTRCTCCGQEALFFAWVPEYNNVGKPVLVLRLFFEHTDRDGSFAHMTKDHIIPKTHGGPNTMDNYQLMCNVCNVSKGSRFTVEDLPVHLIQYVPPDKRTSQPIGPVKRTIQPWKRPAVDPYEILYYKALIRFNTIVCHKNSPLHTWTSSVRKHIRKDIKATVSNWDETVFNMAYLELTGEIKSHPTHVHKGKPNMPGPVRPATMFKEQNKKSL